MSEFSPCTPWSQWCGAAAYSYAQSLLTSTLDGSECSNVRSGRFNRGERTRGIHWTGTGLAPEKLWTLYRRQKSLAPTENRITIPRLTSPQPSHYTHWAIPGSLDCYFPERNSWVMTLSTKYSCNHWLMSVMNWKDKQAAFYKPSLWKLILMWSIRKHWGLG